MHLLGAADYEGLIFGPYFLVPFGFALAVLLLEIGVVGSHRRAIWTALAVPLGLALLAQSGLRADAIYHEFLGTFSGDSAEAHST